MIKNINKWEEIKIVIAGLDNAGKTSALIALRKKYNFYEEVKNLKPTIKIEYSSFNYLDRFSINLWDAGGQSKYRNIYINNPIYFTETNYLYYLIDIQDELKFEESLHYLQKILDIYRELEYKKEVIICFNKYDPKYNENPEYTERTTMITKLILTQNTDMKFKFFNTSIYDISSLSKAFSYSLNKLLNLETINIQLKRFGELFECNHAILYSNTGLIISDYYNESMDSREFEEIISSKISENLEFFQKLADDQVNIDERVSFINNIAEYVKKYDITLNNNKHSFYLGISIPLTRLKEIKSELKTLWSQIEASFKDSESKN
jgi:small GTP-binding protein